MSDEDTRLFLDDAIELLDEADRSALRLDEALHAQRELPAEALNGLFRCVHTLKGNAGMMDLADCVAVAHALEWGLDRVRAGALRLDTTLVNRIFEGLDALRTLVAMLADPDVATFDAAALAKQLEAAFGAGGAEPPEEDALATRVEGRTLPPAAPAEAAMPAAEASVRVATPLLDRLMTLMGELVLTRNQLRQLVGRQDDPALAAATQRLSLLTSELQEAVMRTRMQPVGQVWDKLPRLVRDHCQATGKLVQLEFDGAETELDKGLLEAIKDPLTHLVRNAVDHGVEPPAERVVGGKPAGGTVWLSAHQDGGQIHMVVRDDGRGLDLARIRDKAQALGLVSAEALARAGDAELAQLIFHPGFSTAEHVTAISGRGVGMDVVKANVERIGGTIDVASTPGEGAAFTLRIPLTLAVIPALVVHAGGERFALPQASVLEVVRTGGGLQRIEQVREALVYRLRDALVPVVPLAGALGLPGAGTPDDEAPLVVVQAGNRVFGLAVSAIGDTEEIVVKPLHPFLQGLDVYGGVTIMGDGHACMILDVASLATRGGLAAAHAEVAGQPERSDDAARPPAEARRYLTCQLGERAYALPMEAVARLEEVAADRLERLGDRLVLQYGQELLTVIAPEAMLGLAAPPSGEVAQVVVLHAGDAQFGLRVQAILDIAEAPGAPFPVVGVPGVMAATVLGGRTTEILDVGALSIAGRRPRPQEATP